MSAPDPATSPGTAMLWVRAAGNWANLSTPLGLLVAAAGGSRLRRGPRGLWLAEGYRPRYPDGLCFTIGNVVTSHHHDVSRLYAERPHLLRHEEQHTWQWALCAGLPFLPVYGLMTAWSWLRRGDLASGNAFERRAGLADGGYAEAPVVSLSRRFRGRG